MKAIRQTGHVVLRHGLGVACAALALLAPAAHAQQGLSFFKNYFVTGDYVAGGVALRQTGVDGFATGSISIAASQIPEGAEILAAHLYWQTVSSSGALNPAVLAGARFKGYDISQIAVELDPAGTAPCWSGGGGTGSSQGSKVTRSFRADVLRFFPRRRPGDPTQPVKAQVTGGHEVRLPDMGGSNQLPSTLGAGLLLVYRVAGYDPGSGSPRQPLRSIVIYDGGAVMDNSTRRFNLTVEGFYEASRTSPSARMTHMVANGQANKTEVVRIRSTGSTKDDVVVATNPFAAGTGFEVRTFENLALEPGAMKAAITVDPGGSGSFDCLNWTAVVLSTEVQDRDADGLLDVWESQTEWSSKASRLRSVYSAWPLAEPAGGALPDLQQMGASPSVQDVFVQLDYMTGAGHSHLPSRATLRSVATAFRNASPRPFLVNQGLCAANATRGQCPINIHFDVGSAYQPPASCSTWAADCAFVPAAYARGGNAIPEQPCLGAQCTFPDYPVVRWKTGFRQYRDGEPVPGAGPRFPRNRKDIFRYGLLAHAIGVPSQSNPAVPRKISGIADSGGGADFMVTLGLWDNQTGSDFVQGATLMHELGHTFGLRHGGIVVNPALPLEPNCKPNYQSVMNYLFQVRGLLTAQGVPTLDFSRQALPSLSESALSEQDGFYASPEYMPRWYAPQAGSFIDRTLNTSAATRRCDGSKVESGEPAYVRVDADPRRGNAIDWNADGVIGNAAQQDVNFDGEQPQSLAGANDFATMDLRQIGARRPVGSKSLRESVRDETGAAVGGGLSLDAGYGDLGYGDLGYGDLGYGDLGYGDLGYGDLGYGDLGYGDLGYGDLGYGDLGVPADSDDPFGGELDLDTAGSLANAASALTATALKGNKGIALTWLAPHVGGVLSYDVYRVLGSSVTQANLAAVVLVANVSGVATATTDNTNTLRNSQTYTYFVIANLPASAGCTPTGTATTCRSGVSNFATVTY